MRLIVTVLAICSSLFAMGQPNFQAVTKAVETANIAVIAQYLDNTVEVTIGDSDGGYSKAEAQALLTGFLAKQKPSKCSVVHSGKARDGESYFCIGRLLAGGVEYRVYLFFKKIDAAYKLQEVRFEEN
jgi:hypothetical protein